VDTAIAIAVALFAIAELRSLLIIALRFAIRPVVAPKSIEAPVPTVVIQIPAYREQMVLGRLLDSIARLKYPHECLAVHVLDDSEGADAGATEAEVRARQSGPIRVKYFHRAARTGYKAGNLNYGLQFVEAELVAVVDADCELYPDFLARLAPCFDDANVAGVQAHWEYRNGSANALAVLQAAALDSLFCFENAVRARLGSSAIFLGSGGIWRTEALRRLRWQEAPFTAEDIDLSFRCRHAGWRVAYFDEPLLSCELPSTFLAYKSQQRRWARSCFQLLFDHLTGLARGGTSGLLEATMLFRQLGLQFLLLIATLSSVYVLFGLARTQLWVASQAVLSVLMALSPLLLQLILTMRMTHPHDWLRRAKDLLRVLPLGIGLSITLFAGFCDTLFRPSREWEKTLRSGEAGTLQESRARWLRGAAWITAAEGFWAALTLAALIVAVRNGYWESWLPFAVFASGFGKSAVASFSELAAEARAGSAS
jgi:cellulose synthase/poly-beta-1,6-N-acetylglucosamine synthase-like glycosyltransferase